MRLTPPCVLRAALFRPCVLRTAMFWPRVPFNNKTTNFGNSIYIMKIKWQYSVCTCKSFLQTLNLVCLLVRTIFRYAQINVYVNKCWTDPKRRKRSELFDFVCHVCCDSWWKLKCLIIISIYKERVHNFFVDQYRPSTLFLN